MTARAKRRNNAPVRPRRPATVVPDFLFAIGMALLTMAAVFFAASFVHDDLSAGDAGTMLARVFASTLLLSALFLFILGLLLLRADRNRMEYYVVPLAVGIVIGALESWLFLEPKGAATLLLPFLLLVLLVRPIRRAASKAIGRKV